VKRFFTQNIGLKIFSLAVAATLWFLISGSRELTTAVTVPVQYRNIPTHLELGSNLVEEVRLIVRGPSPLLSRVANSPAPVVLDLGRVRREGVTTFSIQRANVDLPAGVVLERAIPSQIQIRTERREVKDVPVSPVFENVPEGYRLESWTVTPPRLPLSGPKSRLDAIETVRTDPIDLRAHAGEEEVTTTAFAGDPQAHFVASPQVRVRYVLRARPAEDHSAEKERR
jgi:YbbR domain-containing protein